MYHTMPDIADLSPVGAVITLVQHDAAGALASLVPGHNTLDNHYGKYGWFVFWDEDSRGRPVRGSIQLAYGSETLVIG